MELWVCYRSSWGVWGPVGVTDSPRSDTDTSQLGVWDPLLPLWDTFNGSVRSKASTNVDIICTHSVLGTCFGSQPPWLSQFLYHNFVFVGIYGYLWVFLVARFLLRSRSS